MQQKKQLGQNFLINQNVINKIVDFAKLNFKDKKIYENKIYEIGPGSGALTVQLLQSFQVRAIEIDPDCVSILSEKFAKEIAAKKLEIVHQDVLKYSIDLNYSNFLIGNLPYNIGAKIIEKFLLNTNKLFKYAIFMLQKEVADKILSAQGRLGVCVQAFYEVEKKIAVSASSFYPAPDVESTVISLSIKESSDINYENLKKIVDVIFQNPRKKITSFKKSHADLFQKLNEIGNYSNARPSEIKKEDIYCLSKNYII